MKWHHTELGRRTDDAQYRIVRHGDGWQQLDAEWTPLADCPTIEAAQHVAERQAARAAANLPRGTCEAS